MSFVIAVILMLHAGQPVYAEVLGGAPDMATCHKKNQAWFGEQSNRIEIKAAEAKGLVVEVLCIDPVKTEVDSPDPKV